MSQPAPAVGRFKSARQDAAFGHQQASDSGGAARSVRCVAYGHRPRLAPSGSRRPQGVASLCPGLSHYAPLGLWEDDPNRAGAVLGFLLTCTVLLRVDSERTKLTFYVFSACMEAVSYQQRPSTSTARGQRYYLIPSANNLMMEKRDCPEQSHRPAQDRRWD